MGQQSSKDELVYQQVSYGNVDGIKSLRRDGAGLEWIDREGKTPLILACMNSELYNVAKTLIELGANVNAYRPGRHAGTPLHHAAKRGLEQTVKLLISHGANALVMNDDCQTPLEVARAKGCSNVVRAIENHICLFSGSLRELYGPSFLGALAPQLLSRDVWVVVLPCGSRNLTKPFKLELAIYSSLQDAQPRTRIALWKANMEEPKFNQHDPAVVISDIAAIPRSWRRRRGVLSSRGGRSRPRGIRQSRIKLAPAKETDKQQLQWFCNACKGIPQVTHMNFPFNTQTPIAPATAPSPVDDLELAMAISASIQSAAMEARPPYVDANPSSQENVSSSSYGGWDNSSSQANVSSSSYGGWGTSSAPVPPLGKSSGSKLQEVGLSGIPAVTQTMPEIPPPLSIPSAPPVENAAVDDGPIHYPSIDSISVVSSPLVENLPVQVDQKKEETGSSLCAICLDAPVEGACIPCGHMAGCMSCLNDIKSKKWGCPVCRAKIDQVIRIYAV